MADEKKKAVAKEKDTSETAKAEKKAKKPAKFSFKKIGASIARFFKDLRGEAHKTIWPSGKMVVKSTGVVLAAVLIVGAGIWIIDYALAGGYGAIDKLANEVTATEEVSETEEETTESEDTVSDTAEDSTESTTAA